MKKIETGPFTHRLVLLGGGHSHVQVIRHFTMHPLPNTQIVVVSRDIHTPYSGMLPGLIAGHYDFDQCHIDLAKLTRRGNMSFIAAAASGIDLDAQVIKFNDRPDIYYDTLSINLGSVPNQKTKGVAEHGLSVKPIDVFLTKLESKLAEVPENKASAISVVGGGAAGIEVAMALRVRLDSIGAANPISLIARNGLLTDKSEEFQQKAAEQLALRDIRIIEDEVVEVLADSIVLKQAGDEPTLFTIWAAGAMARPWLKQTGLQCTDDGFIAVEDTLRSVSHHNVFAVGDVATVLNHVRPKAGVFAVRQGKPLIENLQRQVRGRKLKPFAPQQSFLTLLACGDKFAIGSKGKMIVSGKWVWHWKDYIDQKFMQKFSVEPMPNSAKSLNSSTGGGSASQLADADAMRCGGCGGKISGNVLADALNLTAENSIAPQNQNSTATATITLADAAISEIDGVKLIQSIDFFTDCIFDDFRLGQLIAIHAVNDLIATGIKPQTALSMLGLPQASDAIQSNRVRQIVAGINLQLAQWGISITGGHTAETALTQVGLSVSALQSELGSDSASALWLKSGAKVGDAIVLTQAIGSGVLLAGYQGLRAEGKWIEEWLQQTLQPRLPLYEQLKKLPVSAATDVSGFGLLGHLAEICRASQVGAILYADKVPLFAGAKTLVTAGVQSSLLESNRDYAAARYSGGTNTEQQCWAKLLSDPQTAGGFVIAMSKAAANEWIASSADGYTVTIIGEVTSQTDLVVELA